MPLFYKPRTLPYSVRDQVETELGRLEEQSVITRVERSQWAAPLVVVPKTDGTNRLCSDYTVTVNQVIEDEPYTLPMIEDLFANLAGGQKFTKLNLSTAYQQLG